MRSLLNRTAVVAACVALTAPAQTQAQSAGDEQYSDPFDTPAETVERPAQPKADPQPAGSAPAQGASAPSPLPDASTGRAELARTGQDLRPLLAAGLALLAGGLMLLWRSSPVRR